MTDTLSTPLKALSDALLEAKTRAEEALLRQRLMVRGRRTTQTLAKEREMQSLADAFEAALLEELFQ